MKGCTLIITKKKMFSWSNKNKFTLYKVGKFTYHFRKLIDGSTDEYYNAIFTECNSIGKFTLEDTESNIHETHKKGLY